MVPHQDGSLSAATNPKVWPNLFLTILSDVVGLTVELFDEDNLKEDRLAGKCR